MLVDWNGGVSALFPLDGAGWLAGDVIGHPVDALHFVDDAGRDPGHWLSL